MLADKGLQEVVAEVMKAMCDVDAQASSHHTFVSFSQARQERPAYGLFFIALTCARMALRIASMAFGELAWPLGTSL